MADLIAELARIGHVANRDTPSFTDRTMCLHFLRTHHAEIAAAVRDASRYRWLREQDGSLSAQAHVSFNMGFDWYGAHGDGLDQAIDTAKAAAKREG